MPEKFPGERPDSNEREKGREYEVDAVIVEMRVLRQDGHEEKAIELFRLWVDVQEKERERLWAESEQNPGEDRGGTAKFEVEIEWNRARIYAEAMGDREGAYASCSDAMRIAILEQLDKEIIRECARRRKAYRNKS